MTVLFLDVDGVLNTSPHRHISFKCVERLGQIVKATQAIVILHSGWKYYFDRNMVPLNKNAISLADALSSEGIFLNGKTPDMATPDILESKKFSEIKAKEILGWLKQHDGCDNWIVLDDLDLNNSTVHDHQIYVDPHIGLSGTDVSKAIRMSTVD